MKKTWSILNQVIRKQHDKSGLPDHFNVNNITERNPKKIANEFYSNLSSIGKNISDNVPKMNKSFHEYLQGNTMNSFFFSPTDPIDIIDSTHKLKAKSTKGNGNVSTKLMKETISEVAVPLAHIFNLSFTTGIVPNKLKIGKITPIYKSGNKHLFNNYRPISVLPAFSKILEKLVCNRLTAFLDKFALLYKFQFGFRKNHSTVHPIIHFLHDIGESNDNTSKDITVAVFLDLSKAFDTINHDKLLHTLNFYGVRGVTNAWFSSYLSDRKQYIEFNGFKSDLCDLSCGVPQGSILGPLLFLIYINDVMNSTSLKLLSFADDTTIYASSNNINDTLTIINNINEMTKLYEWLCVNKLSINISKTNYSLFGPSVNATRIQ